MNEKRTMKRFSVSDLRLELDDQEIAELQDLKKLTDEEVERRVSGDPDARPAEAEWLREGEVVYPKKPISIRLDEDVIGYFKRNGKGYQSRINAVLKKYVRSQVVR